MLEIPVIAQGFEDGKSPYQVDEDDAKHMWVITDNKEWERTINSFISQHDFRQAMGARAKEYVLNKYDINKNINKWESAYQSLLS